MDRRIARTRAAFADAALGLLLEDGWDALTTRQLCERADLARSTFYLHFSAPHEPIFESLRGRFETELGEDDASLDPDTLLRGGRPLSHPVYAHVERHLELYRRIFGDPRGAPVVQRLRRELAARSEVLHAPLRAAGEPTLPPAHLAALLAGALVGSLDWWVHAEPRPSASAMSYRFSFVLAPGVLQSLGLEDRA